MAKNSGRGIRSKYFCLLLSPLLLLGFSTMTAFAQQGYPPPQLTPTTHVQGVQNLNYWNMSYLPIVSDQKPPQTYRSYYMADTANMRELGRIRGDQNANLQSPVDDLAVFFWGEPQAYVGDIYGVKLLNYFTPMYIYNSDVQAAVQDYVSGYLEGSARNPTSALNIVLAVNTSGIWITQEHGKSWGDMVEYLNYVWLPVQTGYNGQIHIFGGMDIEPGNYRSFNSPPFVKNWLRGYATVDQNHLQQYRKLYVLAAASGCPDSPDKNTQYGTYVDPGVCGDYISDDAGNTYRWTQEDLYQLTWWPPVLNSYPDVYPIPQIYAQPSTVVWPTAVNGVHARQWYKIALYTYLKHNSIKIHYSGVISQQAACEYNRDHGDSSCFTTVPPLYNSKDEALGYLINELLTDPFGRMTTQGLSWKTDVGYYEGQP